MNPYQFLKLFLLSEQFINVEHATDNNKYKAIIDDVMYIVCIFMVSQILESAYYCNQIWLTYCTQVIKYVSEKNSSQLGNNWQQTHKN